MPKKKKTQTVTVRASVELDVQDITQDWSQDEAFDFIVALDAAMQDWSFTQRLFAHFSDLDREREKEEAEDAARTGR